MGKTNSRSAGYPWQQRLGYLALVWLVVFGVGFGVWPRSWQPAWLLQPPLQPDSAQHWVAATTAEPFAPGPEPLQIGVAEQDITALAMAAPLAGHGRRAWWPAAGLADPLSVRAAVIRQGSRRVALITADLLLINVTLATIVLQELRQQDPTWQREELFFGATHTHSGPGGYPSTMLERLGLGPLAENRLAQLAHALAAVVRAAEQTVQPGTIQHVATTVPAEWLRNRTLPDDACNRWLDLIVFRTASTTSSSTAQTGSLLGVLVVFSAHATCRRSGDWRLSGDYPGRLAHQLSNRLQAPVLFFAGSVGSMAPASVGVYREDLNDWYGDRLAELALTHLHQATAQPSPASSQANGLRNLWLTTPLPPAQVKIGDAWQLSPLLASVLAPCQTHLHLVQLGPCLLIGTPADYSGVLAAQLRQEYKEESEMAVPIITSFNGDYIGYILPAHYDQLEAYEPRQMSFYGAQAGPTFQELIQHQLPYFSTK